MKKAIDATVEELIKDIPVIFQIDFSDETFWVRDIHNWVTGGCGKTLQEALIAYGRNYWSDLDPCFRNQKLDWSDLL